MLKKRDIYAILAIFTGFAVILCFAPAVILRPLMATGGSVFLLYGVVKLVQIFTAVQPYPKHSILLYSVLTILGGCVLSKPTIAIAYPLWLFGIPLLLFAGVVIYQRTKSADK